MRIGVAQIDPVVGALEANVKKIKEAYTRACAKGARLLVTPELSVFGYPPHDLIDRPEIFERNEKAVQDLIKATRGQKCALAVGHITRNPGETGRLAQNVVSILEDGRRVFVQAKSLLPTYDVFDEARYFEPSTEIKPWLCDGKKIGIAICEDLWVNDPGLGGAANRKLYARNPVEEHRKNGVDLLISHSASPYEIGKLARREALHSDIARTLGIPLVYVNQVGATDEVLFDGGSFAVDAKGERIGRLPVFKTSFGLLEVDGPAAQWESPSAEGREDEAPSEIEGLTRALITGIRDYFARTGFKKAIVGLSGGIDSAVVATLAARALGPQNVRGIAMPSQHSSSHALRDAEELAQNLGIVFEVKPIKFLYSTASRDFAERRDPLDPIALENLQSRLRGLMLMTLSNHDKALVLTTGNKSELAVGYCTLYGDMCGALAPIGDLLKTRVYELARHLNAVPGNAPIPESSITKAPSAELRPGQIDQDSLLPYELLDVILAEYLEKGTSVAELKARFGSSPEWKKLPNRDGLEGLLRQIEACEHKRRQAAPVLKISGKAFGIGRRLPIAKQWEQG